MLLGKTIYSLYTNNANYNQTRPIATVQNHLYNQIRDTHVGNSYQTNNLHAQHHLDQAINNPISSNSQQNRDPFGENISKFFNYQNYNQAQPIPTMHSTETYASFLPGQEKFDISFLLNFLQLGYLTTTETRWLTTNG